MDKKNERKSLGTLKPHPKTSIDAEKVGIRCPRCNFLIPPMGCEGLSKGGEHITTEQDDLITVLTKVDVVRKGEGNKDGVIIKQGLVNGNVENNAEKRVANELMILDGKYIEFPNSEFYNFDQFRKKDGFATGQLWAIYDDKLDVMPRSYAQIVKVFSPGFKVEITWLEAEPDNEDEINWVSKDLPVACGKFKYGETDITQDLEMFSHAAIFTKVNDGFLVYPRKGETWAIFKSWDMRWSSNPDNHMNYEFDFVEILADYDKQSGSIVGYLEKVEGFVCLFKPKKGASSFHIPPHELLRFSHMVPQYRTTGKEKDGVPEGYFELDPASLPAYLIKDMKEISPLPQQRGNNTIPIQQQLQTGPKWSRLPDFFSVVGYQGKNGHGTAASQTPIENDVISTDHRGSTTNAVSGAVRTGSRKRPKLGTVTHNASRKRRKSFVGSSMNHDTGSNGRNDQLKIPVKTEDSVPVGANCQIPKGYKIQLPAREECLIIKTQDSNDEYFVGPHKDNQQLTLVDDESKKPLKERELKNIKPDGFATHLQINRNSKKWKGSATFEKRSGDDDVEAEPCRFGKEAVVIGNNVQKIKPGNNLKLQSSYKTRPELESTEIAEPEFYDFNNDRMGDCFETDQVWAVYDSMDGMPRLYARIRKVFAPVFKVKITWLDFDSRDEELPVSCGNFIHGETETTENLYMFSHTVTYRKHTRRGLLAIYPRKGQTWGLFKNWDLKWNSNPENYKNYEYELVEILSDYSEGSGIRVAYLEKLKGFVSLFRQNKGVTSFQIPPNELQRFSHMVPSYRTTDKERVAPEGSLELDPASLPCNIKELAEVDLIDVDAICSKSPEENAEQLGREKAATTESVV